MEDKLLLILIFILIATALLLLWNNITNDRIMKRLKNSEQANSDEKYFELKAKIQYLNFAGVLLIAFIGALGYNSFTTVEANMLQELDKKAASQTERTDSLINNIIVETNNEINRVHKLMVSNLESASKSLEESREEVSDYNNQMKNLYSKIGYNQLNVIDQFKITNFKNKVLVIPYKNFGFDSFNKVPTLFINPIGNFDVKTVEINTKSFSIQIENATKDTVSINILFFVK